MVWICKNLDLDLLGFGLEGREEGSRDLDLQGEKKGPGMEEGCSGVGC